jgi:phosphoglycolate phosphatase
VSQLPPRPEAVLFDWDGTLVDNWPVIHAALNATLASHGMAPWSMAETYARISGSQRDSFPIIFGANWQAARDQFYAEFERRHLSEIRVLPGAEDLLAATQAAGFYLAVVSNKQGKYLRLEAEHLGWAHYFRQIVGAGDAHEDKPSAAPIHLALDGSAISAGQAVWLIGDSVTDVRCARAAGCRAVIVQQDGGNPNPLAHEDRPDLEFMGLPDLVSLVRRLGNSL